MNDNPWRSPHFGKQKAHQSLEVLFSDGSKRLVELVSIEKTWMTRTFMFDGDFQGTITYDPRSMGHETIYVNTRVFKVLNSNPLSLSLVAPIADFEIEFGDVVVPARIEVKCSYFRLWKLTKFRLTIAGQLVYQEP